MSPHHCATLQLVDDNRGRFVQVLHADDVIWIAEELWQDALDRGRPPVTGDMVIDGEIVTFGTPGEGLGRLTYRQTRFHKAGMWRVCERMAETPVSTSENSPPVPASNKEPQ